MEIYKTYGKLLGILVSTKIPECITGTLLLKDLVYCQGNWKGNYMSSKHRQVEVRISNKKILLILELDLVYKIKRTQWFKERI